MPANKLILIPGAYVHDATCLHDATEIESKLLPNLLRHVVALLC